MGSEFPIELRVGVIIVCCHCLCWRKIIEHLVPTPYWSLVIGMFVLAALNCVVKVLVFLPVALAPRTLAAKELPAGVRVSVVVPAYNEADGIGDVAHNLLKSTASTLVEFFIVNDRSSDSTWAVLQKVLEVTNDSRLKPVQGGERGRVHWKGKNWAVWQGYEAACAAAAKNPPTGKHYILVLDADVTLHSGAIEAFVASMERASVGWVSFVPKTQFSCFSEYLFNWPRTMVAQALIPRGIVQSGKVYAFGQCNLFSREVYEQLGGHREVGHLVAESHSLAALAKEKGIKMHCELAFMFADLVWYNDFWECWKGQIKSIRGRLNQDLPVVNVPVPQTVVAVVMSIYLLLNVLPSILFCLQVAKLFLHAVRLSTSNFVFTDGLVLLASALCISCSFATRLIGYLFLGYDMKFWWMAPISGSVLTGAMAVRACRPDSCGRWSDGDLPQGFVIPKDAPKKAS